jgi:hypothetical protein
LSLSLKRVDDGAPAHPKPGEDSEPPTIDLSEDVFSDEAAAASAPVAELDEGDDADADPDADDDGEEPESTDDVESAEDADSDEAVPAE